MRIGGWIRVASTSGYAPSISTAQIQPCVSHCGERASGRQPQAASQEK